MPARLNPPLITFGVVLECHMTLNAFAKLHWLTTVDIMWLKAAHAFSQPLFCGPTGTDQVAEGGAMNEQEDRK